MSKNRITKKSLLHLVFILFLNQLLVAQVSVGSGSYASSFPGKDSAGRNDYPTGEPQLSGSVISKPVPTNDWWSKLVKEDHADNLFNYPMTMKTTNTGLIVTYIPTGRPIGDNAAIHVGLSDLNTNKTTVSNFSDWTVTMDWNDQLRNLKATSGIGMPFVYFEKNDDSTVEITINSGNVTISNELIIIENASDGSDFVVYAPTGSSWSKNGNTYSSGLNNKNYWSISMLPLTTSNVNSVAQEYKKYAYVFPVNTTADWSFDESSSIVSTTFTIETELKEGNESNILQGLLPHQWNNLSSNSSIPNEYSYETARGELKTLNGNTFTVENTFRGILPTLPNITYYSPTFKPDELHSKIKLMQNDKLATWTDSYNEGQVMNRLIQTARIADQTGDVEGRDLMISTIKERLQDWLTYENGEVAFLFFYNNSWSTLLGYPSGHGQDSNINDHHFHWGYFIHAAAFLEQFEPGWASEWGEFINLLIRDAASMNRDDSMFPYLRNFSPYAGHSWANGFATFPHGNDQESTSESMQFASSLIHWGTITNNDDIRDLGIYIYTTEQTAIEEYWFDVYERNFDQNHQYSLVSRVWGNAYDNGTFWTSDIAASYGIELYPIHGGSFYLSHNQDYAQKLWAEMEENTGVLNNITNDNLWYDTYWKFLSMTDPQKALDLYNSYPDRNLKFGISDAQTYHWLHAVKSLGKIDVFTTANYPIASVFNDNGTKTYVAHNYSNVEITVEYSDGYQLIVPANKMITSRDIDVSGSLTSNKNQINVGESIELNLNTDSTQITKVEFYEGDNLMGEDSASPYSYSISNLDLRIYNMYSKIYTSNGFVYSNVISIQVGDQKPYENSAHSIPGTIEAGHFDFYEGGIGQNISYYDSSTNNEGNFRTDEYVDAVTVTNEGDTVGWITAGEWLEYTIEVETTGCYDLNIRFASGNSNGGGPIYFEIDDTKITEDVRFSATGDWNNWNTKSTSIELTQGTHILKLVADQGEVNIGKIEFIYNNTTCPEEQESALPFDFESYPTTSDFNNFDGGTATVEDISSPQNIGNSSSKLAKIIRDGGQPWAGSYINLNNTLDFSTNKYLMLDVWTEAPIGTPMQIKLEQQTGSAFFSLSTPTTVSGEWETLYWDFSQLGSSAYDKLVFMFDINNVGDGSNLSTFYFDNVLQTNSLSTENFTDFKVNIFPNPIKNELFINSQSKQLTKVEIFTILGKKVKEIRKNIKKINVEDLSSGLYLVKIYSQDESFVSKIIKE